MIFRTPSYYKSFRCIADKCTDNCCIGWEIAIDSETADFYKSLGGDFGERLCQNISKDDTFILKGERCPFLNGDNLCDIIINCGEDKLCQICRDHPRYFEWYSNIKEGGVGLSCEEAARLILTCDKVTYDEAEVCEDEEEVDEELFAFLLGAREEIFSLIDSDEIPFAVLVEDVLSFAQKIQFLIDNPHLSAENFSDSENNCSEGLDEILRAFGETEAIDESWTAQYERLCTSDFENVQSCSECESYCRNIFRYFIWRYFLKGVFDGEVLSKVKLAVVSAVMIRLMAGDSCDMRQWINMSKLYSKQMEYSDENRELFYDMSYERPCFDSGCIVAVCEKIFSRTE